MTLVPLWPTTTISYREIGQITSKVLGFPLKGYSGTIFTLLPRQRFNPTMVGHQTDWVQYLDNEVHAHRKSFVTYYIDIIPGWLNRPGSSPAESNHSS